MKKSVILICLIFSAVIFGKGNFILKSEGIVNNIIEEKYSRIPVYENDIDNIIGILYIKDLIIEAYKKGFDKINIRKLLHQAYFIPETKNINELFPTRNAVKNIINHLRSNLV